jgi:hypothetical protein
VDDLIDPGPADLALLIMRTLIERNGCFFPPEVASLVGPGLASTGDPPPGNRLRVELAELDDPRTFSAFSAPRISRRFGAPMSRIRSGVPIKLPR